LTKTVPNAKFGRLEKQKIKYLAPALLKYARNLSWHRTRGLYTIWVAEIMIALYLTL
jgi:adenine-specific DNA glycosylase